MERWGLLKSTHFSSKAGPAMGQIQSQPNIDMHKAFSMDYCEMHAGLSQ